MTRDEWADVLEKVRAWWPSAPVYRTETIHAWFDALKWASCDDVLEAYRHLFHEGVERPPTAGQISRRLSDRGPRVSYAGPPCTCYVAGFDSCQSTGHPPGWKERQRKRDWAVGLVLRHEDLGVPLDPSAYNGDAFWIRCAMQHLEPHDRN